MHLLWRKRVKERPGMVLEMFKMTGGSPLILVELSHEASSPGLFSARRL